MLLQHIHELERSFKQSLDSRHLSSMAAAAAATAAAAAGMGAAMGWRAVVAGGRTRWVGEERGAHIRRLGLFGKPGKQEKCADPPDTATAVSSVTQHPLLLLLLLLRSAVPFASFLTPLRSTCGVLLRVWCA